MPRRKSGIGRQPGDDFGKFKKPQDIQEIRPSSRFSFRVPKRKDDLTQLNDECGFEDIKADTNLLSSRGWQEGELVLYDPIQQKNYLSQYQRYEAALNLQLHSTAKLPNGKTAYRFCSHASPVGYWEVQIGGATFVKINNPILTIICPRPFKLADVASSVETDDSSLVWEQLIGRDTVISPASGDGSLDPTFVILPAARDPLAPPILIRVSLASDVDIGDTLAIATTATSTVFGLGSNLMDWGQDPCRSVQRIFLLPAASAGAIAYDGTSPLYVGWLDPTCGAADITGFTWQQNTTGQYLDVQQFAIADPRRFLLSPGTRYRVITRRINQLVPNFIDSPRFEFDVAPNSDLILADEKHPRISSTLIEATHQIRPYTLQRLNNTEQYETDISSTLIEATHQIRPYTLQRLNNTEQYETDISSTLIEARYQVTAGGGIVIG